MSKPILEVSGLGIRFGALAAVDDVSFMVQEGSITSVIGPNGAGKSTLFNLISGAIKPLAGKVMFDGQDVTGMPPHRMLKAGLSPFVPDHQPLL
jgi:branched-chain amino acid transport system ATP-binding protein